ncbi:MAG: hypothetical protein ABH879_04720 [archaeon]
MIQKIRCHAGKCWDASKSLLDRVLGSRRKNTAADRIEEDLLKEKLGVKKGVKRG